MILQEFIEDAALIFERRFDIGIFVLITSVDPLRVYIHEDWRSKWVFLVPMLSYGKGIKTKQLFM